MPTFIGCETEDPTASPTTTVEPEEPIFTTPEGKTGNSAHPTPSPGTPKTAGAGDSPIFTTAEGTWYKTSNVTDNLM